MVFIIGTTSSLKIKAVEEVINAYLASVQYKIVSKNIESNVPHTPFNDQTFEGAKNRAEMLLNLYKSTGDYFVGIESGLVEREGALFEECWCVIYDKKGKQFAAYSSGFMLPEKITKRIKMGETHIDILRNLEKELDIHRKDTWAIYSHNRLRRADSIKEAFRNALLLVI